MNVRDLVKVSYMRMKFRDVHNDNIIYDFQWSDDIGEADFIDEYGCCKIVKIKGHCDDIINIYVNVEEHEYNC